MNSPTPIAPPKFKLPRVFWAGVVLFTIGSGPLLLVILCAAMGLTKDPNPNPVGFGIMAMLSFYPSLICMIGGTIDAILRHRIARKRYTAETR